MIEYYLAGYLFRTGQIVVDASIWIAFGCFIAAILRNMIGATKTRALFGEGSRWGLVIAWAIGMLLPVCSLGVIPVVRELHRMKVGPGTIVAFGLTAPLFNPISILYGLSLSDPIAILVFAAATVLIVTAMGAVWGRMMAAGQTNAVAELDHDNELPTSGTRRSVAVLRTATSELVGWCLLYLVIGMLASATVAITFPHGSLQSATEPDDSGAPAFMALFVTPIYSTPLLAMSQIGGMFQHGNSIGAAFSLLILGAGVNLGLLAWFGTAFGLRRVFLFFALLFAMTIAIAYSLDKPLYPRGVTPAGHTHAFDIFTHPYHSGQSGLWKQAVDDVGEYAKKKGIAGPLLLVLLVTAGTGFRLIDLRWSLDRWLHAPAPKSSGWDIALPSWIIGLVACSGLVAASIFGTLVYYPESNVLLDDLSAINATCVVAAKTRDFEAVEKTVTYCDDLSRRLEVSVFLRTGSVSDFRRAKARVYREKLDELRDNIEAGQTHDLNQQAMELYRAYQQLSRAFREQ